MRRTVLEAERRECRIKLRSREGPFAGRPQCVEIDAYFRNAIDFGRPDRTSRMNVRWRAGRAVVDAAVNFEVGYARLPRIKRDVHGFRPAYHSQFRPHHLLEANRAFSADIVRCACSSTRHLQVTDARQY